MSSHHKHSTYTPSAMESRLLAGRVRQHMRDGGHPSPAHYATAYGLPGKDLLRLLVEDRCSILLHACLSAKGIA